MMKRSLLAIALLGVLAGSACAQELADMRGIDSAEAALEGPANTDTNLNTVGGGIQPHGRLGFQGAEYLGSGLTVSFIADNAFRNTDNLLYGTPSALGEHQQAYAGLQGRFGSFKFGRQYSPLENADTQINPLGIGLSSDDFHALAFDNSLTSRRLGNAIGYASSGFLNGFHFEGMSGYDGADLYGSRLRETGFSLSYTNGPAYAAIAQQQAKDTLGLIDAKTTAFGAAYTLDSGIKLSSMYQLAKNGAMLDTRDWLLGVSVPYGANTFMASYIRHINRLADDSDANQFALGYSYSLTKHTNLFTYWAHLAADSGIGFKPGKPGDMNNQFNAGIRHEF